MIRSRRSLCGIRKGGQPYIGRRTGKPIIINARIDKNGFERISDYFPDTDSDDDVSIPRPTEPEPAVSQGSDGKENGPVEVKENVNASKLNTSKRTSSTRTQREQQDTSKNGRSCKGNSESTATSNCSPETEIDSSPVFLPDKLASSAKKPVSSMTKKVSSPVKRVSSLTKQVSSPVKPVSSPVKQVSSQEKQATSSIRPGVGIPPASVTSPLMLSSPEEDVNPGTTRKKLQFSRYGDDEETRLDVEQSLVTANEIDEPVEDEYIIEDSRKDANASNKKTTTEKSAKSNKKKTGSRERSQNKDDLPTREIRKSNDIFLTLKKKSNITLPKTTTSKTSNTRQDKAKTSNKRALKRNNRQNSEKSSGFLSDDETMLIDSTFQLSDKSIENDSSSCDTSTVSSESEEPESTIKAPQRKKKKARKLDSATRSKIEVDETEHGLRRSQRTRVPALQYWKNERIEYKRSSLGFVVKDIILVPTPAPTRRKRVKKEQTKSKSKKVMREKDLEEEEEEESDLSESEIPDHMIEVTDPESVVVDPDAMKEIKMKLIHSGKNLDLKPPSREDDSGQEDASLLVDKYFSHPNFGAGEILLRPGAEKGRQHVRRDTMMFHIISGHLMVSVHNQSYILTKGSSFFVPPGNVYNIKNLHRSKDAQLLFTQIKDNIA